MSFETAIYQWQQGERRLQASPAERAALLERVTGALVAELTNGVSPVDVAQTLMSALLRRTCFSSCRRAFARPCFSRRFYNPTNTHCGSIRRHQTLFLTVSRLCNERGFSGRFCKSGVKPSVAEHSRQWSK